MRVPNLLHPESFRRTIQGKPCNLYVLRNKNGLLAEITNYGGRVVSLWTPDKQGQFDDIVFGFETLDEYLINPRNCYGATIGRYANRIGQACFELEGKTYHLTNNDGENQLHGGRFGFHNVPWDVVETNEQMLELFYLSKHGEEGFPGNLSVKLRYTLTDENGLFIEYWTTTDKACPVNLTHHSFFNLLGAGNRDVLNHRAQINSDYFIPVNKSLIPLGYRASVKNTPMDFRTSKKIGVHIDHNDEQLLVVGGGYDHSFEINQLVKHDLAARVQESTYGRTLELHTNKPAVQFYSVNSTNTTIGKRGKNYGRHGGFCLETQYHPDSPNHTDFPSCILRPGEESYSYCRYQFGVEERMDYE